MHGHARSALQCGDPAPKLAASSVVILMAMALDDGLLARAPIRREPERSLTPGVAAGPGGAYVSLGGSF